MHIAAYLHQLLASLSTVECKQLMGIHMHIPNMQMAYLTSA